MTGATAPRFAVRPALGRVIGVVCWAAPAVVLVLALLRISHADRWDGGAVLSAGAPIVFLVSYPALEVSAIRRRRAMSVAALVCVAIHLWWFHQMLPVVHTGRGLPSGATQVRVMTANLLYSNERAAGIGPVIAREHPDVLALEEFSTTTAPEVQHSGALAPFRYEKTAVTGDPNGIALFSRLPLSNITVTYVAGRQIIQAVVATPAGPVTVFVVHTVAPISHTSFASWHSELTQLTATLGTIRGPLIVAGDFNATDGNRPFVDLMHRAHLRDGLDSVGRGYATTWPQDHHLLPALVRPDHVLFGRGIVALRGQTLPNPGSDHRALVVDLGVRPS